MTFITTTDAVNGSTADASLINNNNTAIKNVVNGNIDNSNVASSAAIAITKLAQTGAVTGDTMRWTGSAWSVGSGVGQFVTALPGSPYDGQTITFTDSLTAPTYMWFLRYISGATTYKWYCFGGTPKWTVNSTASTTSSATYVSPTNNVTFTTPLGGDWDIEIAASFGGTGNNTDGAYAASYDVGGTAASDEWACDGWVRNGSTDMTSGGMRVYRHTGVASSTAITGKIRKTVGGTTTQGVTEISLRVFPFRVG